jgi:hypothetical protein
LVTGNYPPESKDYVAIYKMGELSWRVASYNEYNGGSESYVQKQGSAVTALNDLVADSTKDYRLAPCSVENAPSDAKSNSKNFGEWRTNCIYGYVGNLVTPANQKATVLLTSNIQIGSGQTVIQDSGSPISGSAHLEVPLQNQNFANNPNVLFTVNADWLGVEIPEGKPQIISTSLDGGSFNSGEKGRILVVVKNSGDSADNFVAGLSKCDGIMNVNNQGSGTAIQPGETKTLEIDIQTLGGASEIDEDCKVQVTAQNSALSETSTVKIKMLKPVTGSNAVSGNVVGLSSPSLASSDMTMLIVLVILGIVAAVGVILWKGGYIKLNQNTPNKKDKIENEKGIFCTHCGIKQEEGTKFCTSCGEKMD